MSDHSLRILVVEDSPHDLQQIRRAYSESGYPVDIKHCVRAEEALDLLTSSNIVFDVLISDYHLPGISGLELCKRLLQQNIPFPLLMLTGTGSEMVAVEAMKLGVSDYLIKDPGAGYVELLPEKVREVVRRHAECQEMQKMEVQIRHLSHAMEQSTCAVIITDLRGVIEYTNCKASEITGYAVEGIVGKSVRLLHSYAIEDEGYQAMWKAIITGREWHGEFQIKKNDEKVCWVRTSVSPINNTNGMVANALLILEDVTETRRLSEHLAKQAEKEQFQHIFNASPNALLMVSFHGAIILANVGAQKMFGYPHDQLIGLDIARLIPECFRERFIEHRLKYAEEMEITTNESAVDLYGLRMDGSEFPVAVRLNSVKLGKESMVLTTIADITARMQSLDKLHEEKERLRLTLESIGDAVITTDANGMVDYINPIAEKLIAYPLAEAVDQPITRVFPIINEHDRQPCPNPVSRCLKDGKVVGLGNHTILINRSGDEYSIKDSAAPIRGRDGKALGVIMVFSDVTEQRRISKQIAYQASHDPLTELVNRREFDVRLQRAFNRAKENSSVHALCYLDLDQFKVVNDTCGHVAGDELLRQIANVLYQHIRARDTLARLGGDEFGILMENCTFEQAHRIAEALRQAVGQYRFVWEDKIFNVGASLGVVAITESDKSAGDLLMKADTACYAAKREGRNRTHVYQNDGAELSETEGEMQWVSRINHALENDRFHIYFQPIRSLKGYAGFHYELLIRMKEKNGEIIVPGTFMPAAERYALTTKIDCYVIQRVFRWLNSHPKHFDQLYQCAINLSGLSLGSQEVLTEILEQFGENDIPPDKICLEITETAAIANLSHTNQFMEELRSQGCRFALDDFGSGLSSFAYLKNLPVDYLKIDGGFVKNILKDATDQAMVKSINEIGHVMGKQTIAEFAEDDEIIGCLSEIGVDFVQGFGVGRPRPIEEIENYRA
ncbi:MAG: EAL domain-containing protein [Pseudomonadales bacterium]